MQRRRFIKSLLTAGAALGAGRVWQPRRALAASPTWGAWPEFAASAALAPERQARNVLEVFLMGGLSPWETFYVVDDPAYGKADGHMWWTFQEGADSVAEWYGRCGGGSVPMLTPFTTDALGAQVKFGPFSDPLRSRSDITERLRVQVLSHGLFPHDAAQALAYTGAVIGQPHMAGVGVGVNHHVQTSLTGTSLTAELPAAYVIADGVGGYAAATGAHPGMFRPLQLRVQDLHAFVQRLDEISNDPKDAIRQALLEHHASQLDLRLHPPGASERVRSRAADDYAFALQMRQKTALYAGILSSQELAVQTADVCGAAVDADYSRAQFRLAALLLNLPDRSTRHVTVVDRAFDPIGTDPDAYDTHWDHVELSARKLPYMWSRLLEIINEPGESDPSKLNLDETMIVVNTEFGRSLGPQLDTGQGDNGRNHYPRAYVTAMFGGPLRAEQRGLVGAIDSKGAAVDPLQPAETRAASLCALGIYPFDTGGWSADDINGADSDFEAALKLKEDVLGVSG